MECNIYATPSPAAIRLAKVHPPPQRAAADQRSSRACRSHPKSRTRISDHPDSRDGRLGERPRRWFFPRQDRHPIRLNRNCHLILPQQIRSAVKVIHLKLDAPFRFGIGRRDIQARTGGGDHSRLHMLRQRKYKVEPSRDTRITDVKSPRPGRR